MKKNFRKCLMATFIISMGIWGNCFTALAAEDSLANFQKSSVGSSFSDIQGNEWYAEKINEAQQYGLISGFNDGTFKPQGNLTVEQALSIGARIHATYKYGQSGISNQISTEGVWYQGAIDYCKREGLIGSEFDSKIGKGTPITRAEMVHAWSKLLQDKNMEKVNTVITLPDVTSSTTYGSEIIRFYEVGITSGTDANGTFKPNNNITRAEAATIFMNLIKWESRATGKVYPNSNEISSDGLITIDAQTAYINQLLSNSKGVTWTHSTGTISFDFDIGSVQLPAGFKWGVSVAWNKSGENGGQFASDSEPEYIQNGHFNHTFTKGYLPTSVQVSIAVFNSNGNKPAAYSVYFNPDGSIKSQTYAGADGKGDINPAWADQVMDVIK